MAVSQSASRVSLDVRYDYYRESRNLGHARCYKNGVLLLLLGDSDDSSPVVSDFEKFYESELGLFSSFSPFLVPV